MGQVFFYGFHRAFGRFWHSKYFRVWLIFGVGKATLVVFCRWQRAGKLSVELKILFSLWSSSEGKHGRFHVSLIFSITSSEVQYRSNVSYHRLARNETRLARNETRLARNEIRLAGNENCLERNETHLASALEVPLLYQWFFAGRIVVCGENRWADMCRIVDFFGVTEVQYFLALSGQFLCYMYWSTWSVFVLSARLS